jgi:hypothetical protein
VKTKFEAFGYWEEIPTMRTLNILVFSLFVAGVLCATAVASDFTGSTVAWQYYAYGGPYTQGTSSGTFTDNGTVGGTFNDGTATYFNIIAGPNFVEFDYSVCTSCPNAWSDSVLSLAPTIYNGIDLKFSSNPTITSVTIDPATNMAGFNSSYFSFTGNEIQVDWHQLPFDHSTVVKLDLNNSSTPEPGTLLLMGSGLMGAVGVARRKLKI